MVGEELRWGLEQVRGWMKMSKLRLSPDRLEVMVMGPASDTGWASPLGTAAVVSGSAYYQLGLVD